MTQLENLLLLTDSYKTTHYKQYPPQTEIVYSFFESRGNGPVTFFGLQYLVQKYLAGRVVTEEKIRAAKRFVDAHMGPGVFHEAGWRHILTQHDGHLPIHLRAVPEGTTHASRVTLMTLENTDPACYWLTNYLETLLVQVWYPTTVCTQSRRMKQTILGHLKTSGDPALVDFKLHDFGFRGSTSVESSALGAAAHLVNFKGTDTMSGLILADEYYHEPMAGFSIPASEHSTITSWGRSRERDAFANMLTQYPTGLVACVSDSYDIYRACSDLWGTALKDAVIARDGMLVVRPDSGDPLVVLPEVFRRLGEAFGTTRNVKGFKMLHPKVRVIQGDGIDPTMLDRILDTLVFRDGWSADNIAFGSGGGLLQKMDRDTHKFAFKCSAARVGGVWRDVQKQPVTDTGKVSRTGRFYDDALRTVLENGRAFVDDSLAVIRERAGE